MVTLTSTQKDKRLENEYNALKRIPLNGLWSWRPAPGETPPRVRRYLVYYYDTAPLLKEQFLGIKTLETQKSLVMEMTLTDGYPQVMPAARIIEGEQPYLPNFFTSGSICFGHLYTPGLFLWEWFNKVGQLLLGDPEYTGYTGNELGELPANSAADAYYRAHMSSFPVRKVPSPRPADI